MSFLKKNKIHVLLGLAALLTLLAAACQKTALPPDEEGDPVFLVNFNSVIPSVTAGVNGVYLYTDYLKGADNVLIFRGNFAPDKYPPSTADSSSVQFEFRNLLVGNDVPVGEVFHEGDFEYANSNNQQGAWFYRTKISVLEAGSFNSFVWDLGSLGSATGPVVQRDFPETSSQPFIVLQSTNSQGVKGSVGHLISLVDSNALFPQVSIRIKKDSMNENEISAITKGSQIAKYSWNTGQTTPSFFDLPLKSQYQVTVTDSLQRTAFSAVEKATNISTPNVFETPDFYYSTQQVFIPSDTLQLGKVAIQWIDSKGVVWRSDRQAQSSKALFKVAASNSYELNEQGQKTWKMQVSFFCRLFSPKGEFQEVEGSGTIAVGYLE